MRVFAIPAASSGYLTTVLGGFTGSVEVVTLACDVVVTGLHPERLGPTLISISVDGAATIGPVAEGDLPRDPRLEELHDTCGSSR